MPSVRVYQILFFKIMLSNFNYIKDNGKKLRAVVKKQNVYRCSQIQTQLPAFRDVPSPCVIVCLSLYLHRETVLRRRNAVLVRSQGRRVKPPLSTGRQASSVMDPYSRFCRPTSKFSTVDLVLSFYTLSLPFCGHTQDPRG